MKGFARGALIAAVLIAGAGLGIAGARPGWLPGWSRAGRDRLVTLVRRLILAEDDEEDEQPAEARSAAHHAELVDDGWCDRHAGGVRSADRESDLRGVENKNECRRLLPVVRLASSEIGRLIGLETAPAAKVRHAHRLAANAETAYDAQNMAEVIPRVGGVLRSVRVDLGQQVRKGDVLAVVDSAQVGAAKAGYLTALASVELARVTHERTLKLTQAKAAPGKTEMESLTALVQAETNLRDAEQKLRNLGFDDGDLAQVARTKDVRNLLEIVAPIEGSIITWDATRGEAVEPTTQLFALADTRRMWLWIDVYETDIAAVAPGQQVTFLIAGTQGPTFTGRVTWIGTEVNALTRTTRVRAELPNPAGRLRANQFGQAHIRTGNEHEAILVPRSAVQELDGASLVFVVRDASHFVPQRLVVLPTENDAELEVTWGLKPGQRVATTRSYELKAEMLRDRLGAADND